jgi:hypothetical protein
MAEYEVDEVDAQTDLFRVYDSIGHWGLILVREYKVWCFSRRETFRQVAGDG